ncbi:outer membrane protein OmpA-like peptidoglycan-associated protein [Litorivivens lipolytica]|uniref:Outer membrane protein OmpA-like peptidoglycan-associated protein n=1 Tax=Litorivivens lipolytica TaxID=1524264 RepID=A0A7W4Z5J2_9GAMM|nr:OmpA family protein [Litorivivens lipolytica]MBB3045875.1 outer membrane protein OmpA-like peptidoglycan-associated protein [Litorivivens lipolytica]
MSLSACSYIDFQRFYGEKPEPETSANAKPVAAQASLKVVANPSELDEYLQRLVQTSAAPLSQDNVGYYMDVQYATLQHQLRDSGIELTRGNREIQMIMPGAPTFEAGSDRINPEVTSVLSVIGKILTEYDKTLVTVVGHTDASGGEAANHALAQRRALAVGEYLNRQRIAKKRLAIMSYGSAKPIANNDTAEGRAQNRRIELILKPIAALAAK